MIIGCPTKVWPIKNEDKCDFIIAANTNEHLWVKVGNELIWESSEEKLLRVTIDKNLNFNKHLSTLCNKVSQKVTALARVVNLVPFENFIKNIY